MADLERQTKVRSAELGRLLQLDPALALVPAEIQIAPIEIVDASTPMADLLAAGLATRPEIYQQQALVWAAGQRIHQEQWRPWLREAAAAARETYRLNKLKIREGEGLPLELLQAITSLGQSLDAYLATVNGYNRAQFRLLRAIGKPPSADRAVDAEVSP